MSSIQQMLLGEGSSSGGFTNFLTSGGVTATALTTFAGSAQQTIDGNNATQWQSNTTSGGQLDYDLGVGITKTAHSYNFRGWADGNSQMPAAWDLTGSNDGTNYTALDSQTGQNPSAPDGTESTTYTFSNGTAYRYYRWHITATALGDGKGAGVREFRMSE